MCDPSRIDCPVEFQTPVRGEYANAFRVMQDLGQDVFLDFLVYSPAENIAYVISRIRVHKTFLHGMRKRLGEEMVELRPIPPAPVILPPLGEAPPGHILVQDGGKVYYLAPADPDSAPN